MGRSLLTEGVGIGQPCSVDFSLQVVQLFRSLQELGKYILDMMKNHLMVIDLKSEEGITHMKELIK